MGRKSSQKRDRRIAEGRQGIGATDPPWTPLEHAPSIDGMKTFHDGVNMFHVFVNSRYTVMKREFSVGPDYPPMVHLSIKRNDRKPVTSWRDLQRIKNELVGPECEGVQIFPAESRLVDTANQTHLYISVDQEYRLPFGYNERLVAEGNYEGAIQEPFEDHVKPDDLADKDMLAAKMAEARQRRNLNLI